MVVHYGLRGLKVICVILDFVGTYTANTLRVYIAVSSKMHCKSFLVVSDGQCWLENVPIGLS